MAREWGPLRPATLAAVGLALALALALDASIRARGAADERRTLQEEVDRQHELLAQQEKEITRLKQLRQDERAGRIALETGKRKEKKAVVKETVPMTIIGSVCSPFPDRRGTPRQPQLVPAATGLIVFNKQVIQHAHFAELAQFSHVWVLFLFHENTNDPSAQAKAKIRPPRLHGESVGCLSTRSPHRPNAVGLSVCEVVRVGPEGIHIRALDMVDGTPVLDVKPYIPYDLVPSDYELPMATDSQGRALQTTKLRVPAWIVDWDVPMRAVRFSAESRRQLHELRGEAAPQSEELVAQVLRQDIRGMAQRSQDCATEEYVCRLDGLVVRFHTGAACIDVIDVSDRPSPPPALIGLGN